MMCNDKREEIEKLINKCVSAIDKANTQALELQSRLCDSTWVGKYKNDPIVIVTYSETVRKLRKSAQDLKAAVSFLKNRLELRHIEIFFDDKILDQLEKLNTNVESQIDKTLMK